MIDAGFVRGARLLTSGQQSSESLTFPSSVLYRLNDELLKEKINGKAKKFADRIHQQYLVNLTRGKDVKVTNDDDRDIPRTTLLHCVVVLLM